MSVRAEHAGKDLALSARWTGTVRFFPEKMAEPLRRRKPTGIFVGDMGDIALLTNEQIAAIFGVMAACPQHRFYLLTKRPGRLREWFEWMSSNNLYSVLFYAAIEHCDGETADRKLNEAFAFVPGRESLIRWPLPNVWVGTSVCTQADADKNIPALLRIPAAVRFLSVEPMLEEIRLPHEAIGRFCGCGIQTDACDDWKAGKCKYEPPRVSWVIIGGESGPNARPCHAEWLRSIVRQCREAGVATWVKQYGSNAVGDGYDLSDESVRELDAAGCETLNGVTRLALRDRAGADMAEWPADLRVREMPADQQKG